MLRRLKLLQREAIRIKPRRSYGFRAMAEGDVLYGAAETVYYQVILKAHPNRITKNPNGIIAWADVLHRSCGGAPKDARVHLCAKNPCSAMWDASKYGQMPVPIHLQPTEWRPPEDHAAPTPAFAGEAVSAVNEKIAGEGAEGEGHAEAGPHEEGAHEEAAYAKLGDIAVAVHSGQTDAASVADEHLPEETVTSVGVSVSVSVESHDRDHGIEEAAAQGDGEDLDEGRNGVAEGEEEHPGAGAEEAPHTAVTSAAVAVPLSPPPPAPLGAPLKPRIIPAPLPPACDEPEFLRCESTVALQAPHDVATAALQAGSFGQTIEAGSRDTHPARLCRLLSVRSLRPTIWREAIHVGGHESGRHSEHVRSVAAGALQRALPR